jgi:Zn-dependent peptidase ImmA (M78 family)
VDSLDKFLEFHIEKITADKTIPIDLTAVSVAIGAVIEEREMIPEAAMHAEGRGFCIYLQSNFVDMPGAALRRRFSLAHEIGHTLFYEERDGELKPRKDAPRGDGLEVACHKAASMILVPGKALRVQLRQDAPANSNAIVDLANQFEVSVEVMVRRLSELGAFENTWAPVLARRSGGALTIEYAAYPPWLKSHLNAPSRGVSFNKWFRGSEQADGGFKKKIHEGVLEASPVKLTGSSVMFELRMQP